MASQEEHPFYIHPAELPTAVHHESFHMLWETKWRKLAELGVYPFMFGHVGDFDPIVKTLCNSQMKAPYDWDEYALAFFPTGTRLVELARTAAEAGHRDEACEFYLRASAVYRIARLPLPRSKQQRIAWDLGKEAAIQGLKLKDVPIIDVKIPHRSRIAHEGLNIPAVYCVPDTATARSPAPVQIIITGLDGYRTDLAVWCEGFAKLGVATLIHEIPGTGDCPALVSDPTSPDRLYDSILAWIEEQDLLDGRNVCVWGFSTGGYYAIRVAHTHPTHFKGVVAQGGGAHYMFDPTWLNQVNRLEYPFDLANCLSQKFGYGDDVEAFKQQGMDRFSLLLDGTLDKPECSPLLLVNGLGDEIYPIDDYYLLLRHGPAKQVRLVPNEKHMGEPDAFHIILAWLYSQFDSVKNDFEDRNKTEQLAQMVSMHLGTIPFKARFVDKP